ncbi:MAG TPA: TetR/AcrR family transcriptional regulator [Polyangiaceae bacterium]
MVSRRGDALREHILQTAKRVFLETGFERASMDEVAKRASTSKRSLYAHFESKEKLFLEVIELVRGLFLGRLGEPVGADPIETLTAYCARYLEGMIFEPSIQLLQMTLAETERFPEAAARHHDVIFVEVGKRISAYLRAALGVSSKTGIDAAQRMIALVLHPQFTRALFGQGDLVKRFDPHGLSPKIDVRAVRRAVTDVVEPLGKAQR